MSVFSAARVRIAQAEVHAGAYMFLHVAGSKYMAPSLVPGLARATYLTLNVAEEESQQPDTLGAPNSSFHKGSS